MRKIAADRNYKIVKEAQTQAWHPSIRVTIKALRAANRDLVKGDPVAKQTFDDVYNAIDVKYRQSKVVGQTSQPSLFSR